MLINLNTGEIAFHCLMINENGGLTMKQYPLKNDKGNIKFIAPKIPNYYDQRI